MPIKPENKHRYPKNWKEISKKIRFERAKNMCESCGVYNNAKGIRLPDGSFQECPPHLATETQAFWCEMNGFKMIKIVLTVAHLDHNPENNDESNLMAMCQRCHNRYDRKHRNETRNKAKKQLKLFT